MRNSNPNLERKIHWYSVVQFALSVLAIFNLWSSAFGLIVVGMTSWLVDIGAAPEPLSLLMMAAGMIAAGLLLVPSASYALWRLLGREVKSSPLQFGGLRPSLLILAFPLVLLLGYWAINIPALAWLLIPPLHVLAIGLPVLWLLYLGVRDLPLGSPQRRWGVFGSGLVLGPVLILALEAVALLGLAIVGGFFIAGQPDLVRELSNLAEWLSLTEPAPEMVFERLGPYLMRPGVIFAVITFGALIVPLIEEALKPIGVWLLIGRNLRPSAGFAAGVLSGAGYALFESLAITTGAEDWISLVVIRVGTTVIHILTTGLTGWALTLAWRRNRYLLLGFTYLGAVLYHGLWNGLTLLNSFATLSQEFQIPANIPLPGLANLAPNILGAMAAAALLALLIVNRHLARAGELQVNLAEMPAPAQMDGTEYNPPEFAVHERPADTSQTDGE